MPTFEGDHLHALTNTLFHYRGEFEDHVGVAQWRAEITLDGTVVGSSGGSTPYDTVSSDAMQTVIKHVNRLIDAKDFGQRPNVLRERVPQAS